MYSPLIPLPINNHLPSYELSSPDNSQKNSYIAGTTHLDDPSVLETIKVGDMLSLQREDNKFDSNAILILNAEGKKLGYVPEKDNLIFARLMDAGKLLKAKIGEIRQKGSFKQISVGIFLVDL